MCFLHNLFPGKNETSGDYCPCGLLRCQCLFFSPPPPPPPPPPASGSSVSATVIIIIVILCISFIFVAYYAIIVKCCSCWRSSRASPAEEEPEDDDDSDDGMQPANFIWYVNTVGLDESVIKSISMCKYKRGDGLVEGTECSVCLTEFRDGEYLRLLPKCSHTFHVNCIDTWLKSHVNCPVCRARVVSDPPTASSSTVRPSGSSLLPNSQNGIELQSESDGRSTLVPEAGISEHELRRNTLDVETLKRVSSSRAYYELRVLSDLAENRRLGESSVDITGGDEAQQVRRSASMDSSSLSNLLPKNQEMDRRTSMGECSGTKRTDQSPMYGYDRRLIKLTSKSTFGPPLFGAPVAMKRSFSSGGRFFLSRYSKGKNSSVIPL